MSSSRPAGSGRYGYRRDIRDIKPSFEEKKVPHKVLNARYHQQEADIVSRAGQPGAITISTNMAGRGTDIKLGKGYWRWAVCTLSGPNAMKPGG